VAAALLGLLAVAAVYAAGKRVYGPAAGLLMASLLAFQPTFLHLSGSINNDMPLTAVAAMVMAFAVLLVTSDERRVTSEDPVVTHSSSFVTRHFFLGLLCAAAILTKANGVFVLVFPAVVLLGALVGRRSLVTRRSSLVTRFSSFLVRSSSFLLGLLPLWAGWLWLNTVRMRDTLGLSGSLPVGRVLSLSPLDFVHVGPFLPAVWRSYWLDWSAGDVGYGPDWLYGLWLVGVVGMVLGWLRRDTKYEIRDTSGEARASLFTRLSSLVSPMVLLAFLAISYLYFAVKALTVKEAGWMVPEARWWLPGLPMLAWLLAAGYRRWWSPRRREVACLVAAAVPPLIAFGLLLFHLPALYPRAEALVARDVAQPVAPLRFDDALTLLDATAGPSASPVAGPASVDVILTWQADRDLPADYTVNTQLLAQATDGWRKLAEHNSFPGQGMNPTRGWAAGDIYRDRLTLPVDELLNGPTVAAVQVRVTEGGPAPVLTGSPQPPITDASPVRDLPPTRDGRLVDAPLVASVIVRPPAPLPLPGPVANAATARPLVSFADSFDLLTWVFDYGSDPPELWLWWRATAAPPADYTIFVQLFDATGALLAQADAPPNDGLSPTSIWREGDVIEDVHRFPAGTVIPPDGRILIGAYRPDTGERAPATQEGAPLPDNAYRIR